jgi:peptidylprolyl isomerase
VLPVVGNPTDLTRAPAVGAGQGLAPTALTVRDLVAGTGPLAGPHDTVTVNYVAVIWKSGIQFAGSWASGQPSTVPLDSMILGFAEGVGGSVADQVTGMRVGGRRMIVIPPRLAYGPEGGYGAVKVDDTVVFVVDLLAASATAPSASPSPASVTS